MAGHAEAVPTAPRTVLPASQPAALIGHRAKTPALGAGVLFVWARWRVPADGISQRQSSPLAPAGPTGLIASRAFGWSRRSMPP
jgi:hypothetical protein